VEFEFEEPENDNIHVADMMSKAERRLSFQQSGKLESIQLI